VIINTVHVQLAILRMTQAALSELIGVSRQSINSIENNRYVPSTILALKIAKVFKVPVEELFELEEED